MNQQEFLQKALDCIEEWKNGVKDEPTFSLIHEQVDADEIEVGHHLIVGKLAGRTKNNHCIYVFDGLKIKEIMMDNSPEIDNF